MAEALGDVSEALFRGRLSHRETRACPSVMVVAIPIGEAEGQSETRPPSGPLVPRPASQHTHQAPQASPLNYALTNNRSPNVREVIAMDLWSWPCHE